MSSITYVFDVFENALNYFLDIILFIPNQIVSVLVSLSYYISSVYDVFTRCVSMINIFSSFFFSLPQVVRDVLFVSLFFQVVLLVIGRSRSV